MIRIRRRMGAHAGVAVALAVLVALPLGLDVHGPTLLGIWALLALSLGVLWGQGGILSLGHAAFFGLGAYAYAITASNTSDPSLALLAALALPCVVAGALGALMFYGRLSDVYMGVVTLVFTLMLHKFVGASAGDAYRFGQTGLGGYNGIPGFPLIKIPATQTETVTPVQLYYLVLGCLGGAGVFARWTAGSYFGRALAGIRENPLRMELLGYNTAGFQTALFALSGAIAGLAGCLFANWAQIVTPSLFSLGQSVEIIVWVLVGGLGTITGPMLGAAVIGSLKLLLGGQVLIDNALLLGAALLATVLALPHGVWPALLGVLREGRPAGQRSDEAS